MIPFSISLFVLVRRWVRLFEYAPLCIPAIICAEGLGSALRPGDLYLLGIGLWSLAWIGIFSTSMSEILGREGKGDEILALSICKTGGRLVVSGVSRLNSMRTIERVKGISLLDIWEARVFHGLMGCKQMRLRFCDGTVLAIYSRLCPDALSDDFLRTLALYVGIKRRFKLFCFGSPSVALAIGGIAASLGASLALRAILVLF